MMMSSSSGGGGGGVAFRLRWDVFLSFRGEDTRECFTKKLYESLEKESIRAFMDDEGLDRGDHIATTLLEAIDDSAASIVIISRKYADSHWCLDELNRICDLKRLIIPVFYKVDPSHVRKQLGPFQDGFHYLEKRFGKDQILKWRDSMLKIGGLAGFVFNSRYLYFVISNIIFFFLVIVVQVVTYTDTTLTHANTTNNMRKYKLIIECNEIRFVVFNKIPHSRCYHVHDR